jgi:hypothetical protein
MILALAISGIIFAVTGVAYCLCAVAKDHPQRGIRVGGVKPFQSRTIENRLALGLLAQESNKNKRK